MGIGPAERIRRWLFLAAALLAAASLAGLSAKHWSADRKGQSSKPEDWLRAAQLEPDNGDNWYRLGRYRQLDIEQLDPALAVSYYRSALQRDPRSATYWMDLAGAYEMAEDTTQARAAFTRAKSVYPISGEVAWRYGNFLLRRGQLSEAFAEIHAAVTKEPKLAGLAISRCWRSSRDINRILDQALPARQDVYLPALDFLVAEHEDDAALVVWQRLLALHPSFELSRALPFLDELIRQDRLGDAKQVWQQALGVAGWARPGQASRSLIWDGGFGGSFANGGFGWRQTEVAGAAIEFDAEVRHAGTRSLRVTFDGTANVDFQNLVQFVPVEPSRRYHFAAYLRSEGISTDSGIRFWIAGRRQPANLNVLTSNLVGSQPWRLEEVDFTTGSQTRLIEIQLRRLPSQKFDNKIRGTVWVDDVSLTPLSQEAARRSP